MARRSSLKTIAEKTGLSVPTVSQILNRKAVNYSSEATKQRVWEAARELGYQPSFGYKLIQGQKTRTVAILFSMPQQNSEEHSMALVQLLIAEFDRVGYAAYCSVFDCDPKENLDKIRTLMGRGVEHFVFLGCPFGQQEIFQEIEERGLSYIGNYNYCSRWVNNGSMLGMEMMFRHLQAQVGNNFKLICQEKEITETSTRLAAIRNIFPDLTNRQIVERFIYRMSNIDFHDKAFRRAADAVGFCGTDELLKLEPEIGAIVYNNDSIAVGGCRYLLQPGNERFRHVLLCGCNNESVLQSLPLPVSSVEFNIARQAELLAQYVLTDQPCEFVVAPTLHIRSTHQRPEYPPWDETIIQLSTNNKPGENQ